MTGEPHPAALSSIRLAATPDLVTSTTQKWRLFCFTPQKGSVLFPTFTTQRNESGLVTYLDFDRPKFPKSLCNGDFRLVGILACGRILR